ncbi:hypothetical protein MNBD_GAMMA22-1434 [hydrothermal vent metagenome]|uniref:HTH cro/C1-type domain-containing protein n=1 Tax=hydrothermal vent metagenome TaxID=652676 RepID=A0A3B1AGU7_9ZZZZ
MPDKKNPTTVQIGQRIKQARKMAGFETASQLLDEISSWGTGRLGNYEAGISLPSPDDIKVLAQITGSSACWIMFGLGPIRATGRDLQAIRHQNFNYIIDNCLSKKGELTKYLKAVGLSRKKIDEYINNPFKKISDRLSRKTEQFTDKTTGWLDEQHVESDPVCAAFPDDMRRIMEIYSNLSLDKRNMLLQISEVFLL